MKPFVLFCFKMPLLKYPAAFPHGLYHLPEILPFFSASRVQACVFSDPEPWIMPRNLNQKFSGCRVHFFCLNLAGCPVDCSQKETSLRSFCHVLYRETDTSAVVPALLFNARKQDLIFIQSVQRSFFRYKQKSLFETSEMLWFQNDILRFQTAACSLFHFPHSHFLYISRHTI